MSTITVNLQIMMPLPVFQDINADWLTQIKGAVGSLASSVAVNDAAITLISPVTLPVGTCLLLDQEPMTLLADATNATVLSVSRGTTQTTPGGSVSFPAAVASTHAANAPVAVLQFSSPWNKIALEGFQPYASNIVNKRGAASYTYASTTTGTVVSIA